MRLLLELRPSGDLEELIAAGRAVHAAGLDGVLLRATSSQPAPLVGAAALAGAVEDILIAADVALGDRHPLEVAEEAAVVDVASGGRLVLVTSPAGAALAHYAEALDIVRTAHAAAPFRFQGRRWRVPASLPENVHNRERLTRVTPAPARARLELWSSGAGFRDGVPRGLGHLADADDDPRGLGRDWDRYAASVGPALIGAPRARRERWNGPDELVASLRRGREAFRQDWAVVYAPVGAAREIGTFVRPRVQLDELPAGLEQHWEAQEPAGGPRQPTPNGLPTDW